MLLIQIEAMCHFAEEIKISIFKSLFQKQQTIAKWHAVFQYIVTTNAHEDTMWPALC